MGKFFMNIRKLAEKAGIKNDCDGIWCNADQLQRFAELIAAHERKECAKMVGEAAKKWWSIHCATNKHMETTRKAHDEFCTLQAAIRARGKA